MTKTANHDEETPVPPPTDTQLIRAFIAEADNYYKAGQGNDYFAGRAHGHAEARRELGEMLEGNRRARAQYVKDAGDRIVKAAEKAGHAVADFLNAAYAKAEKNAERDYK